MFETIMTSIYEKQISAEVQLKVINMNYRV